ncbi:probable transcription factor At5g28040 [Cornus florida]|uniref:probable transcription factor At5g28040 n=1 Tax=Cornus florida TaxID=4283 RepID=UPI002896626B|nr:probable transcription factor At5g28040 [Cornus florida]
MDSTLTQPVSIKPSSARKLPIKRKNPDNSNPNPSFHPTLVPKLESTTEYTADDDRDGDDVGGGDPNPPPFKFHRIWTEPDEIRFLQGLLDCSSDGLSFPRDLNVFYARFSGTMSQPYTKSQLSEKLRRLRKKFRVISSRLARGLDKSALSSHDRSLFELSKRLWDPEFLSSSPFGANNKPKKSNLVGVKVSFSPTLHSTSILDHSVLNYVDDDIDDHVCAGFDGNVDVVDGGVKLSDVNIEFDDGVQEEEFPVPICCDDVGIGKIAGKTVLDVFDHSLKEVRMEFVRQRLLYPDNGSTKAGSSKEGKVENFENRWREQRVAELDVLAHRLRLVLENSLQMQ